MAANEDEVKLRLTAETLGYKKAWADVRVQTARDLAAIKTSVATNLGQARASAAQHLTGIRQAAASNLGQTRVNVAQQLAQVRLNTAQQLSQIRQNAQRSLGQMGSQFESAGRRMTVGLTLPLVALAAASTNAAKEVDAQRNKLIAFEGSIGAANARLQRNQDLANRSVGVTRALANESFALFKGLRGVTDETIEKTIAGVGRLNAVFSIPDLDKFQQNLGQIFNLDFNTKDIREARRVVPIFDQLLESAFGTSNPATLRKLKASGKLTIDAFLSGLSDAVEHDPRLSKVQEAIGTRLTKVSERIQFALAPLGDSILTLVEKGFNRLEPALTAVSRGFASLPTAIQAAIVLIGGFAAGVGPALFITGSLINTVISLQKAYVALNALALIPTISNLRLLGQVTQGTASLTAGAAATTAVRFGVLGAAILAAAAASVAIARATDGWLESIRKAHPWVTRFGQSVLLAFNPLYGLLKALGLVGPETEKVTAAQTRAVPAVKDFSDAVDEETESLKQLKRALAEVELATKSRVAAAQRAYQEERITGAQASAERIKALEDERRAKLALIDEDLRAARAEAKARAGAATQGIGPHGAVDADGKKLLDKIKDFEHQRTTVITETDIEIEGIKSELRQQERQNEERHRESILAVQRAAAEEQIDILRDAAERDESLRVENERKIARIEAGISEAEEREIRRRIDAAAQGTEARVRLEDELAQKLAERRRREGEARRRERDAERAVIESRIRVLLTYRQIQLDVREASEAALVTSLRAVGQARLRSAVDTENAIIEVERRGFNRRIQTAEDDLERAKKTFDKQRREEEVAAAKAVLAREKAAKITFEGAVPGRQSDAEREDIQRLKELNDARKRIQRDALAEALEVGRMDIEAMRRRHASRSEIARAEREADLEEARQRRQRRRDELEDEKEVEIARLRSTDLNARKRAEVRALDAERNEIGEEEYRQRLQEINDRYDDEAARKDSKYLERKKELEDLYRERDLLSEEEYQRRKKEIEDRYKEDTNEDPFKGIKDRWTDFKNHIANAGDSIRSSVATLADRVAESFGAMEDALRQAIVANILYGESIGQALKKALAAQLANLSAELFMQGVKHAAYALGSLAFGNFGAAAKHGAASAAFFAGAGLAGKLGGALAQSAGTKGAGASAAAGAVNGGAAEGQPRNREFTYGVGSTPALDDARGHGLMGSVLAPVLDYIKSARDEDRMRTALIIKSNERVAGALGPWEGAQPLDILQRAADTSQGSEVIAESVLRRSGSDDGFNDRLARNLRVP